MSNERVIKKYANRRLYDSTGSRHVTLDDIRKMIVSGEKVKVIDDKSGEDLTRAVLLQVISEQEQFGTPVLSTELLEGIIRFYGNPVQEMLTRYMEQSVGAIAQQQQAMRAEMAKVMENPLGAHGGVRPPEHGAVGEDAGLGAVGFLPRNPPLRSPDESQINPRKIEQRSIALRRSGSTCKSKTRQL